MPPVPVPKATPAVADAAKPPTSRPARGTGAATATVPAWAADAPLLLAFLGLTFLLGVFPLNDTDFWWHLRTGDLIRQTGAVPQVDPYLFGGPAEKPWIDLHWGFQLLLSLGHQLGGVDLLTLAKCAIHAAAVAILLLVRPRAWPLPAMVLAWLPALLLLAGRMYVRPEALSLLYLSIFLSAIETARERPWRLAILPPVMILWVNSQGLFVLGLVVLGMGLVAAAVRRDAFAKSRRGWWRVALGCAAATALATLANPYGLRGTLFPLQLLRTMGDRRFESIGELEPVGHFIERAGWDHPGILVYLATMAVGVLSFVVPAVDAFMVRLRGGKAEAESKGRRKKATPLPTPGPLDPFRLLLFVAFAVLSLKATRNSHQFAAVAGAVSAWNVGAWLARRAGRPGTTPRPGAARAGRLVALGAVGGLAALVVTNTYYDWLGERRTVGLGEKPHWFPHAAVKAAAGPGMPERFVCVHNGHAATWIYHNGPGRKVFADARLEVIGADLYDEYRGLVRALTEGSGWDNWLARRGRPGLLLDLVQPGSALLVANVMSDPGWRCVYFDDVAALFVPVGSPAAARPFDPRSLHFAPEVAGSMPDSDDRIALAKAARDVAERLLIPNVDTRGAVVQPARPDLADPLLMLAHGQAARATVLSRRRDLQAAAWRMLGRIDAARAAGDFAPGTPRFRMPFDPVVDLATVRATHALRRAHELDPSDFTTAYALADLYQRRGMDEAALPVLRHLVGLHPANPMQAAAIEAARAEVERLAAKVGSPPATAWANRDELERVLARLLDEGRAETAARLLESAYPVAGRSWSVADQIAALWLHLGRPDPAKETWSSAAQAPRPGLRDSRVAFAELARGGYETGRNRFSVALQSEPELFEALYGLAVQEADFGDRPSAVDAARRALAVAPGPVASAAVRRLLATIGDDAAGRREVNRSENATP